MIRPGEQTMNGLDDAYVESVIKKAISGKLNTGQAAAKIPPKTVVDIYVTRSGKRVAAFGGRLWALVEVEKRQAGPKPKQAGRPKFVPGPNHPWRRCVLKARKG